MLLLAEPEPSGWHRQQGSTPGARLLGTRPLEGDPAGRPHSIRPGPESSYFTKTAGPAISAFPAMALCVSGSVLSLATL